MAYQDQRRGNYQQQRQPAQQQTTALTVASFGLPVQPVRSMEALAGLSERMAQAAKTCNFLSPVTTITYIPPGMQLAFRVVQFRSQFTDEERKAKSNGDFYQVAGGTLALSKASINKLADIAAVSWDPAHSRRMDDGQTPNYWAYLAVGRIRNFDGQWKTITGFKEVDMREGSEQLFVTRSSWDNGQKTTIRERMSEVQIAGIRYHGAAHAETKAKLRAIREALALKGSYSTEEASKPFVMPVLVPDLDMSNPAVQQMVTAVALGVHRDIYGPSTQALPPPVAVHPGTLAAPSYPPPHQLPPMPGTGAWNDDEDPLSSYEDGVEPGGAQQDAPQHTASQQPGSDAPYGPGTTTCAECASPIPPTVAEYSMRVFKRPLCREHQPRRQQGGER